MKLAQAIKRGFTLIELLVVIGILAILLAITLIAINPQRQFQQANDTKRKSDVNTILNAVYQYSIDNNGNLPTSITTTSTEICKTGASSCTSLIDLSVLTASEKYLTSIPPDPSGGCDANGVCYKINKTANARVTVLAPGAEQSASISATR